ncbi:MAG: DNA polymerase III subunit alpha [Cryomorphaceae bacterium]|nr:DNA polymerase III subunit alpha [Cryomorphaceae bacterium]
MYLIFDTETTGLPRSFKAPISDVDNWPRVVQLAWQLHADDGSLVEHKDFLIKPDGFDIPYGSEQIHGISTELASKEGIDLSEGLALFEAALSKATFLVGHNVNFDVNVLGCEFFREERPTDWVDKKILDTCTEKTANLCKLLGGRGGRFKLPTLSELHEHLFDAQFTEAHNATADVEATTRCFLELIRLKTFTAAELEKADDYFITYSKANPKVIRPVGLKHLNLKAESEKLRKAAEHLGASNVDQENIVDFQQLKDLSFTHLHNHSQYSILQSTAKVSGIIEKAFEHGMHAIALTDSGNMMAAFHFEAAANKINKRIRAEKAQAEEEGRAYNKKEILPIIGCEFNVCRDRNDKTQKDNGSRVVLLAKNKAGYQNLIKLASIAYTEGMYYVPRIDKDIVQEHKENLIMLSGGIQGEISNLLLNVGEKQAEEALTWWKNAFKDDFYIELTRHGVEVESRLNPSLVRLANKHGVKLIATNNSFYVEQEDSIAHDVLLCVKDNQLVETPKGRGRGFRYGLENDEYYIKSSDQMKDLFQDLPQALLNTEEIVKKCDPYPLARDVLLPEYDIPSQFISADDKKDGGKRGENAFLRHLVYEGANKRYAEIDDELKKRIDFELETIENTGYPGYFLIVQDFCNAARDMDVSVGPGRGSAAGSVVAYSIGITNIDPIKYDLLFERFLNPDRISMPDIDIDFDDEGRGKVIDYVIEKYGANQVAQIITYGTMAAKSAVRDTARVMNLPLSEADRLAKMLPDISLNKLFDMEESDLIDKLRNQEEISRARDLRKLFKQNTLSAEVLQKAKEIEGSVRNTGIHACGVIITPDDLTNFVPVATAKDSDLVCTQYDNSVAEDAGLLKMDFLGLKTLTLIKDAIKYIEQTKDIKINPDEIPIDDTATYELFQRGETVGIFQYESPGMQKYLKELKPTEFADLIAMNALYRPGPMEYIPSYVKRKHGDEDIEYDLADCEEYLKETYGITVYQEQVMLLSQKLADFTKGEADTLRKAMGKKDRRVLDKMKPTFLKRATEKGHSKDTLEKIWKDWEAFASYAFNKSHSTCYAWVAYQTAYLKANYPAEYMASVLSNNMNDIKQVTFFMEESKRMGIPVFGPDINESNYTFTINKEGAIRFGLGAVRGLGSGPIDEIVAVRKEKPFTSVFDFAKRANLRLCNKRVFESLIYAGGLDSLNNEIHRSQYFVQEGASKPFVEQVISYGRNYQDQLGKRQMVIFDMSDEVSTPEPKIPFSEPWSSVYRLNKEKEVVGVFLSGHPLDDFRIEIESFCKGDIRILSELQDHEGRDLMIAAVVTSSEHRITRKGDGFGTLIIEDYYESFRLNLFQENYLRFKHFMEPGTFVIIKGRIEKTRWRKELEFVVHGMELLQGLREKKAKNIEIKLPTSTVNKMLIQELQDVLMDNEVKGNCRVRFTVYDPLEKIQVVLPSRSIMVNPSNELLKKLEDLDVSFALN